ncbi:isochorismatase family cysteine hydrolase [Streptomyces sp. TG1A-8]|uniref:cysteine hydrolase family protein n=1 Tax=Streptomyces sp. TG1A-8 TaxID=3051385 RepID=UPI00265BD3C0|nr:isochorismatase family cysteine hydrolase [Streptomyces sp. TG1A-8]MDO0924680.1 isochorismatase family cysteine hydrolase [Streptomyces sp. TG1A-8]
MGRPALILMDLINDVVHPDGSYAKEGYAEQVASRGVLERAATAADLAREQDIPVIHVTVGFSPGYPDWPADSPVFAPCRYEKRLQLGTWGTEQHERVRPRSDEVLLAKHRLSPFHGTALDLLLRSQGVDRLLLGGVSTDLVVMSAARDAHDRDYRVEVLEDATAAANPELHRAAVTLLGRTATVTSVAQALSR